MYHPAGDVGAGHFQAVVNDGAADHSVSLSLADSAWQHAWLDLSPFSGQTVTVRLELVRNASANPLTVTIDEVSVGSAAAGPYMIYAPMIRR
jgi:hypothetical protein